MCMWMWVRSGSGCLERSSGERSSPRCIGGSIRAIARGRLPDSSCLHPPSLSRVRKVFETNWLIVDLLRRKCLMGKLLHLVNRSLLAFQRVKMSSAVRLIPLGQGLGGRLVWLAVVVAMRIRAFSVLIFGTRDSVRHIARDPRRPVLRPCREVYSKFAATKLPATLNATLDISKVQNPPKFRRPPRITQKSPDFT